MNDVAIFGGFSRIQLDITGLAGLYCTNDGNWKEVTATFLSLEDAEAWLKEYPDGILYDNLLKLCRVRRINLTKGDNRNGNSNI